MSPLTSSLLQINYSMSQSNPPTNHSPRTETVSVQYSTIQYELNGIGRSNWNTLHQPSSFLGRIREKTQINYIFSSITVKNRLDNFPYREIKEIIPVWTYKTYRDKFSLYSPDLQHAEILIKLQKLIRYESGKTD